jgi:serine/threonine-protein kinase RsbW
MILEYSPNLSLDEIPLFTKDILEKLKACCVDQEFLFDVRLSLEEALINAVKHGNKMDRNKLVQVKIEAEADKVEIEIKDQGQGFDPEKVSVPTKGANLDKLSGRGVFLIKNFMDDVEFLDNGSRIRMVKYLKPKRRPK